MTARPVNPSSSIEDFGDWGDSPVDPPVKEFRRCYFSFNAGPYTLAGTARVPSSWSLKDVRNVGLFQHVQDLNVSFDVRSLAPVLAALRA